MELHPLAGEIVHEAVGPCVSQKTVDLLFQSLATKSAVLDRCKERVIWHRAPEKIR